ncbi:NAD-dependent epimerase/dehydratase family protein [Rhodopila sp.]|uniref:NAD-dependent epimerase/dehydratase family protein n=1 Tax=Rhodopila sp. TaxID=2480087 RepID=UPI002B7854C5|nr:NAD(P)-dependent oxidoreductase [Rhodopila sp.]HVZ06576.1 NAD(P)-dependent oxidoreductase [Rhodopila sp.]
MRIAVVGATGVIGRHVIPRLIERGHEVRAIVTKESDVVILRGIGIDARLGNILETATLEHALAGCDVALHLATAAPRPGRPANLVLNDRIRREGTLNLIAACRRNGVERYVQQSVAFLVGGTGILVDEAAPLLPPTAATASAIDMEAIVQSSDLHWTILRGGALYGPCTGRDDAWRSQARSHELRLPADGSDFISLVHVIDFARAFVLASEQSHPGARLSIVDDVPITYRDLLTYVARLEGAPDPAPGGPSSLPSFRVTNGTAKKLLSWEPAFSSYRSGIV